MRRVLNVGGNSRDIPIPPIYDGWEQHLLDIDPKVEPDIILDARMLTTLQGSQYDSVYCSHNLEHYFHHDAKKVLAGFKHVLKEDGFAIITVPDIGELFKIVAEKNLDIDDFLYQSPMGPIKVRDVIYGYGEQIEKSGDEFYAHKTGFTEKSLISILQQSGLQIIFSNSGNLEIHAIAFKNKPTQFAIELLGLS
ncbi:MAG: class I SAM-dependent methyltransferase [Magnetococcales bacterium]|nr:class I SAM-dependent methyltransferase [Magnetococcales bacterium]